MICRVALHEQSQGSIAISIDKAFTSASFSPVSEKNSSRQLGE